MNGTAVAKTTDFLLQVVEAEKKTGLKLKELSADKVGVFNGEKCLFTASYGAACRFLFNYQPQEAALAHLNENYWDCQCAERFIHSKEFNFCPVCKSYSIDCPDSRELEVKYLYNPEDDGAVTL